MTMSMTTSDRFIPGALHPLLFSNSRRPQASFCAAPHHTTLTTRYFSVLIREGPSECSLSWLLERDPWMDSGP